MEQHDYSIDVDEGLQLYDQASKNAIDRLANLGLVPELDRPYDRKTNSYFDGRLPSNLNDLSSRELGELLGMMTQYTDFVCTNETIAKSAVLNAETKLDLVRAKLMQTKTGSAADKTAAVQCDSRYVNVAAEWLEAKEYFELLSGLAEASRRNLRTISRAIETTKMTQENGHREQNVQRDRLARNGERRPAPRPSPRFNNRD